MFLISEQNLLPAWPGVTLSAVAEMAGCGDVLILQFAAGKRDLPRVAMVEFASGAAKTLLQLTADGQIVRGAAVLSAKPHKDSAQWSLQPLSEIHIGATAAYDEDHPLVSFARFTTAAGEEFSMPVGIAEKHSPGKRIYPSTPARSSKAGRRKTTVDVAGMS
ncbi:hypothetical protein [Paraburkholderia sp. WC7.3d]|uniref:hypothetical protein n=1 Tax=Paraburkholderia sp. WC7.3d TaxID=2991069 RepID=UPI003D1983ED